jgi:hypothetical protein
MRNYNVFSLLVRNVIDLVEFNCNVVGFYDFFGPLEACTRFICRGLHDSMMRSYNYSFIYIYIYVSYYEAIDIIIKINK